MNIPIVGGIFCHNGDHYFLLGAKHKDKLYEHWWFVDGSEGENIDLFMRELDALVTDIFCDAFKEHYENK